MKKAFSLALIGATALTMVAGAASAQPYRHDRDHGGWTSIDQRKAELDRRIDRGMQDGSLNRREAYRLRAQFRDISRLEYRYRADGLSPYERADLDRRFDRLAAQIHWQRNDNQLGQGYGQGYDHNRGDYRR